MLSLVKHTFFQRREPISIATSLKTYHKMVLENLSVERGGGFQESLRFSCTAKQIKLAHQHHIEINEPKPKMNRVKRKQRKGLQEAKPIAPEKAEAIGQQNKSLLEKGRAGLNRFVQNLFGE